MLDPVWREQQEICGFSSHQQLEFFVHDNDGCLGTTTLAWCRGFNGQLCLRDSEAEAVLRLKVRHPTDMDYPMGPPTEFKYRAQRASKDASGACDSTLRMAINFWWKRLRRLDPSPVQISK